MRPAGYTHAVVSEHSTHATLLARLADGRDQAAWGEFCDRYGELIRGFARRRSLQAADCDDVVQETLMALTKAMPQFRYEPGRGKFRSYLKTVTLHVIFRKSRQKKGDVRLDDIETVVSAAAADHETDAQWENEWRQHHLRQAMRVIEAEFNEKDRAAFDAYALGGRDVRQTAESLGISQDQVYQAKSRILKRLGQLIDTQVREEG